MKVVIAEKPSVAKSIASILKADKTEKGYFEGNGYQVTYCFGHLVNLATPEAYAEELKAWKIETLPIIPSIFQYVTSKDTYAQFKVLKTLMTAPETTEVICATDAGREGELIFRLVYEQARCKKPIKRLWISSMEEQAILEGFNNLKPGQDYFHLYEAAKLRQQADWLLGINLTRLYTIKNQPIKLSVGRVQTPTLAMIVEQDSKIANFQKEKYFTIKIPGGGFSLNSNRIDDRFVAENYLASVKEAPIVISNVEKKEKVTKPDLPFDLTTLQREANKYFAYSAKDTLAFTQSLYEKKLVTYPRTDARYLSDDMKQSVSALAEKIGLQVNAINFNRCFNSKKVSDHHAIIPTLTSLTADLSTLSEQETKIYHLILNKMQAAFSDNLIEEITTVTAVHEDLTFTAKGKIIHQEGFSTFLKDYRKKDKEEIVLPNLAVDDVLSTEQAELTEKFTTPPSPFTEDTLLKAMEHAGVENLDKDIEIERKGLGTPATRAEIIEKLISMGYITREKKSLISTAKGKEFIRIVNQEIKDPRLTAEWEMKLAKVAAGTFPSDQFYKEFLAFLKNQVATTKNTTLQPSFQTESFALCPVCQSSIIAYPKNYKCSNKDCHINLYKEDFLLKNCGTKMTDSRAKDFFAGKIVTIKNLKSKLGKEYTGEFLLNTQTSKIEFKKG